MNRVPVLDVEKIYSLTKYLRLMIYFYSEALMCVSLFAFDVLVHFPEILSTRRGHRSASSVHPSSKQRLVVLVRLALRLGPPCSAGESQRISICLSSLADLLIPRTFPSQRVSNYGIEIVEPRLPCEPLADEFDFGHDLGWVARPPR